MSKLYADEGFAFGIVEELRRLGHDVLTVQEAGKANQRIPDKEVLAFATSLSRCVVTLDRWHFVRLHKHVSSHAGIVICTDDKDLIALADRIHRALLSESLLDNKLIRVNRPSRP